MDSIKLDIDLILDSILLKKHTIKIMAKLKRFFSTMIELHYYQLRMMVLCMSIKSIIIPLPLLLEACSLNSILILKLLAESRVDPLLNKLI